MQEFKEYFCQFCNRSCHNLNSLKQHEIRCKLNPHKIDTVRVGFNNKGRTAWNEGLNKTSDARVAKGSESLKAHYKSNPGTFTGKRHKEEYKARMSQVAIQRELGGFNMRKKGFDYKGVKLDSSYEVEVARSLDANNVRWIRPKRIKYTTPSGDSHYYTPDFYLPDCDIYLDPKNDFLIENINPNTGI